LQELVSLNFLFEYFSFGKNALLLKEVIMQYVIIII
jgi:hypothetical protein